MKPIPPEILAPYEFLLFEKKIPRSEHHYFKKWLRYYLDFCLKYQFESWSKKSLPHFIQKLQQKNQSNQQQRQASGAISIFYELELFNSRNKIARKKDKNYTESRENGFQLTIL